MSKIISQANLPNVKLNVNSFSLGRGNMDITGDFNSGGVNEEPGPNGAFSIHSAHNKGSNGNDYYSARFQFQASRSWTGTTNSVSPQTNSLGSGQALDITPSFYTTHMWLRTS